MVGKSSISLSGWGGLARVKAGCVFACVGWKVTVTLCDPIWQVTLRSCEMDMGFH